MKRKIITIGAVLALLVVAYLVGQHNGQHKDSRDAAERQMKHDLELCRKLVELDRSFLANVLTRPNALTSGTYMLETTFPDRPPEALVLVLNFSNGQLLTEYQTVGQNLVTHGFTQQGTLVSGTVYDMDEGPGREYVGVIDGDMMWGRVYQLPGQGWREGEPPAYGVWRLCPKEDAFTPAPDVSRRWRERRDYYALLEIVDAYIDPFNHKAAKADVLKHLGRGCDTPDSYPNAGPRIWVYPSSRRVPYGSYLVIEFDEDDMVKHIEWASE